MVVGKIRKHAFRVNEQQFFSGLATTSHCKNA